MPIPDYQTLMLPLLRLFASGRETVRDCLPQLAREFDLTDDEIDLLLPSGRKTYLADRAHWARTYLSKAVLLESPSPGSHVITPRGRDFLAGRPEKLDKETLLQFESFCDWLDRTRSGERSENEEPLPPGSVRLEPDETPEERIEGAYELIHAEVAHELLQRTLTLSAAGSEKLIVDLLIAMGYGDGRSEMGRAIGKSGDGGIDGVVNEDALGLDAVYIQAKRYAPENRVGRPAIQAFIGAMTGESATKGVFVTTSGFSAEARDYVRRVQQRVVLIDGEGLARLMIRHEVGVRARQTYVIRSVDEDYFVET